MLYTRDAEPRRRDGDGQKGSPYEQGMARQQPDAAKGDAGAKNPVAQGTSRALRLPGDTEEPSRVLQA